MNNFGEYITPEEAKAAGDSRSLRELRKLAKRPKRICCFCDQEVWRYSGTDMCFSCTTGESDASGDSELILEAK